MNGVAFSRWKRWSDEEKKNAWQFYGWFTACACCGCAVGALAYAARVGNLANIYISNSLMRTANQTIAESMQKNDVSRSMLRFGAAYYVLFPFELGFVFVAKLLVLHRMLQFSPKGLQRKAWTNAVYVVFGVVLAGVCVGVFSNIGTAVYNCQAADLNSDAIAAWALNDSSTARIFEQQAKDLTSLSIATASVQRYSEAGVSILLVAAFLVVGMKCYRIIAAALLALFNAERVSRRLLLTRNPAATPGVVATKNQQQLELLSDASVQGQKLLHKVVGTVVTVFLTAVVRSVFHVMYAVAQGGQDYGNACSPSQCSMCKNVGCLEIIHAFVVEIAMP